MEQTKIFKLAHFNKCIKEIWEDIFLDSRHIETFKSKSEENDCTNGLLPDDSGEWKDFKKGDRWFAHDSYLWLKQKITVPKEWNDKQVVFHLQAMCYNSESIAIFGSYGGPPVYEPKWMGFEGMFFLNGVPYQGIDNNHQIVILPKECIGKEIEIAIRVWSGTDPKSLNRRFAIEFNEAKIAILDNNLVEFYMLGSCVLDAIKQFPETHPHHPELYRYLDTAIKMIDFSLPKGKEYRDSVEKAFKFLDEKINEMGKNKYHIATDYIIGHTHLDVAWLWRLHQLTEKAARSWLTVLRWMDIDPEYTFLQTQAQLYYDIKKYYPTIYEQIKKRVKEGKWSVEGSMWVEADCNLSSGEALSRQLLYGKRFFKEEFGVDTKTLWLPDVFGYSYALPQILKLAEVDTFITSKISWNQYNRFPHDIFFWRGMDGTDLLTQFIAIPEPKPRQHWFYTYNGMMTAEVVNDAWEAFTEKDVCKSFIHPYGYGDGGGGTTFEQLKMRQYLKKIPCIPNIKDITLSEFNTLIHKEVNERKNDMPIFSGELYLEYHRGTLTSQALIKKNNRKFELALAQLENLYAYTLINNNNICDKNKIRSYWYTLLKNQFHDILPGSSIHNVYEDSKKEFEALGKNIEEDKKAIASSIFKDDNNYITIFNPLLNERKDITKLTNCSSLIDSNGKEILGQKVRDKVWFADLNIDSFGFYSFKKSNVSNNEPSPFIVKDNEVETKYVKLKWNEKGQICSLIEKKSGLELVAKDKCMNIFELLEDKPRDYDAWEFEPYAEEKTTIVTDLLGVETVSNGNTALVLNFKWKYKESLIEQDIIFYSNSPRIDFETKILWKEREKILRSAFYGNVITNKATYDIQYGNIERPTHRNTSWDVARFEVATHKWADLSDRGLGFAILNDCKYGYSALHNCLRITLLKGSNLPDITADYGEHSFVYSLVPHTGSWVEAGVNAHACELNSPVQIFDNKSIENNYKKLISVDNAFVDIDAFKISEEGNSIILRINEYSGIRSRLSMKLGFNIKSCERVNILENKINVDDSMKINGENIEFIINPYEIVTLKFNI